MHSKRSIIDLFGGQIRTVWLPIDGKDVGDSVQAATDHELELPPLAEAEYKVGNSLKTRSQSPVN